MSHKDMKKQRKDRGLKIGISILAALICFTFLLKGEETAVIPGDVDRICAYTNFFYNFPAEDFLYYLNERFLFTDKPDGKLLGSGTRNRLLRIVRWHNVIKKSLTRYKRDKNKMIAINVTEPRGYNEAFVILKMLGLNLTKTLEGKYCVTRSPGSGFSNYFRFTLLKIKTIENQLNKAQYFYFKLRESEVQVPWDYAFLRKVTGKKIDSSNFFEAMLKDEQFSLLLGVLYRLSDKEIDYISSLGQNKPIGPWAQIYGDKTFLMGMFVLSDALRVMRDSVDGKGYWLLPGGEPAAPFWSALAEKDARTSPFEFLRSLAVKDGGKLNYLYLFSYFLPPETQKILFTGPNSQKMEKLYYRVSLTDSETLKETQFPRLRETGIFTFLYSLQLKGNDFFLPHGVNHWLKAMKMEEKVADKTPEGESKEKKIDVQALKETYQTYAPSSKRKKEALNRERAGVYLKLIGGAEFLNAGDFDTMIETNEAVYANLDNPSPTATSSFYRTLGLELGYGFGNMSAGLEVSKIFNHFNVTDPYNFLEPSSGDYKHRFSALAVLGNLYYKVFNTSFVGVQIFGGGGFYFGNYSKTLAYRLIHTFSDETLEESSNQLSLGYHLGLSFDFYISKKLAFFVEGRYRDVAFNKMEGEGNYIYHGSIYVQRRSYTGELYFDPEMTTDTSGLATFILSQGSRYPVSEPGARPAKLSMKGFALTLGAKFYL